MKKTNIIVLMVLILTLVGALSAQDMGDLVLNLEPRIGLNVLPFDEWGNKYVNGMVFGIDYGVNLNVSYYFLGFLSVNAGVGIEGNFNALHANGNNFSSLSPRAYKFGDITNHIISNAGKNKSSGSIIKLGPQIGELSAMYLSIPFGARFSLGSFSIGGGLKENIILNNSSYIGSNDNTIDVKSYFGWYADISFSQSDFYSWGIHLSDSFTKNLVGLDWSLLSVSFLMRFKIPLAKIPLGGNRNIDDSED